MRVVALLGIRNEELYLEMCIRHLVAQGVDVCVIDNDSTDRSLEIVRGFHGRGVFRIERLPYEGYFDESAKMRLKSKLAREIDADWFIHHDADEIREAPPGCGRLAEAIAEVDRQGFNAINFDEFVFIPTIGDEGYEGTNFVDAMKFYYFFEPRKLNRINAWKKNELDELFVESGGHVVNFEGIRVFPRSFILRHYIGLSRRQLLGKYASRIHSMSEVLEKNLNRKRAFFRPANLVLPKRSELKRLDSEGNWDRSDPWRAHKFLGGEVSVGAAVDIVNERSEDRPMTDAAGARPTERPIPVILSLDEASGRCMGVLLSCHPSLTVFGGDSFGALLDWMNEPGPVKNEAPQVLALFFEAKEGRVSAAWPDDFDQATHLRAVVRRLGGSLASRTSGGRWGKVSAGDHARMVDIETFLPEAHFINVIRDGRSMLDSSAEAKERLAAVEGAAVQWAWLVREARQQSQLVSSYVEIKCEDLVAEPAKALVPVWRSLELERSREVDEEVGFMAKTLADCRSEAKEKRDGDADAVFEAVAGPLLRELGYLK